MFIKGWMAVSCQRDAVKLWPQFSAPPPLVWESWTWVPMTCRIQEWSVSLLTGESHCTLETLRSVDSTCSTGDPCVLSVWSHAFCEATLCKYYITEIENNKKKLLKTVRSSRNFTFYQAWIYRMGNLGTCPWVPERGNALYFCLGSTESWHRSWTMILILRFIHRN